MPGLDQLIAQTGRAGLPEGGGASPAWPGPRTGTSTLPAASRPPLLDFSPSQCAGSDARLSPAARGVPSRRWVHPPGDLGGPSASPASVSPRCCSSGAGGGSLRERPHPRPRGHPIGRRRPGAVSSAGRGFPAGHPREPPQRPGWGGGLRGGACRGGAAGTVAGRRRRAWAGDATAPRQGQRAAGAEAAASALPGAASLGALAPRTGRRRTGRRRTAAPGARRRAGARGGSGAGLPPPQDPERRRTGRGWAAHARGPGRGARALASGSCGGSRGPGGRPLLGLPPRARGLPGASAFTAVVGAGTWAEVEARDLRDTGSSGCPPERRPTRRGHQARPSFCVVELGRHRLGAFPENAGDPLGQVAGGPSRLTLVRLAAEVQRERHTRLSPPLRNCPTLRLAQSGDADGPGRASPGQSLPRDVLPIPGPAGLARGFRARVSPSPRPRMAVLAEVRRVGSALTASPD